jgi:hypothetical protein
MSVLKPLCEQLGAKISTRTHNKDPERSHPNYEFVFFSNHNMDVGESPDSGEARRINIFRLCNRFGGEVDDDTEEKSDLKERIIEGTMVHEMFHFTKALYASLSLYTTNIRRPSRVERETLEVTAGAIGAGELREWVLETFAPSDVANSLEESKVKKMFAEFQRIHKIRDVRNRMVDAGFKLDGNNGRGHRYVSYRFGDKLEPLKLKLKT